MKTKPWCVTDQLGQGYNIESLSQSNYYETNRSGSQSPSCYSEYNVNPVSRSNYANYDYNVMSAYYQNFEPHPTNLSGFNHWENNLDSDPPRILQ